MTPQQPVSSPSAAVLTDRRALIRGGVRFALLFLFLCVPLFLAAGTFAWPMGWIYVALTLLSVLFSRLLALRRHPDLLVARCRRRIRPTHSYSDRPGR